MERQHTLLGTGLSLAAAFAVFAGCRIEVTPDLNGLAASQPANNLQQTGGDARGPGADGSVRTIPTITDGTSNTLTVGETPPSPAPGPVPAPSEPAPPTETPSSSGLSPEVLKSITAQLGDKHFSFASSSGNSDRNAFVTGTNEMVLCAFGRFARRETTIFSSSAGDFDSTTDSSGTWSVIDVNGQPVLELRIESSGDRNSPASVLLPIGTNDAGALFLDGQRTTVSDAAADCAAAQATP